MAAHPFDDYLASQPEPQRQTLEAVAASLRSLLPTAVEAISYGMPAFEIDGIAIAGFAGFKRHCSYFPHSGATLERLGDDLAAYDCNEGTLRFPVDAPLPKPLLRKLVAARIAVENERPPRQGKVRRFYDNGVLESRGSMKDGKMHGSWSWFRRDGTVKRTGSFRLGEQTGTWRTFDRAGALVKETSF